MTDTVDWKDARPILNLDGVLRAIDDAWPMMCKECLAVLGSEQHYQAMVYHVLRAHGRVPIDQIGMNVKQWIANVRSELFKQLDMKKNENYRGGFEPTPDVVIFHPIVDADWRRRRAEVTIGCMLAAIEIKASERANGRLSLAEVGRDIEKLNAHREEVRAIGKDFCPVMLVVDSAKEKGERMRDSDVERAVALA